MPERLQLSKPEFVGRAPKRLEKELFTLRKSGIHELQKLLNDVANR